mmetsp:Transcript_3765/g.12277  ORF Transcript_3765/g.12277 Transcript_3765/m.12277 type:complete len:210 (+) Transcript_3765:223-852(+)
MLRVYPIITDEQSEAAFASFPIAPEELIAKAKEFLLSDSGLKDKSMFAEDFEFMGPVVGPFGKDRYVEALESFDLRAAFPDINPRFCMFNCDPLEPGRVWLFSRTTGTFTGDFGGGMMKPNSKAFELPPEVISVTFDPAGKVKRFTIGAVVDRMQGNSGGLGGVFGILYAVGKPLPFREARPWKKSFSYRAFEFFGRILRRRGRKSGSQ